ASLRSHFTFVRHFVGFLQTRHGYPSRHSVTNSFNSVGLKPDHSRPSGATTTGACRCRFRSSGSRSSTVRNSNGTCFLERYRTVASHWTQASFLYTMVTGSSYSNLSETSQVRYHVSEDASHALVVGVPGFQGGFDVALVAFDEAVDRLRHLGWK